MVVTFLQDLEVLQDALLNNLQKLSAISRRKESGESKHDNKDSFAAIANEHNDEEEEIEFEDLVNIIENKVSDFESVLKCSIVEMTYKYPELKLQWEKSPRYDQCDKLHIVKLDKQMNEDIYAQLVEELDFVLQFVDWFYCYRLKVKEILRQHHKRDLAWNDEKRDRAIKFHAVDYDKLHQGTSSSSSLTSTSMEKASTREKLLSKTKQLTNNLVRGNQILQSGILQSDLNLDELRAQTNSLTQIDDKYTQFETVFKKTADLVKVLENASHQEKRDVYLSLGFLLCCISWVLWRRIFKLPVKLGLWLLFKFFKGILVTLGLVKSYAGSSSSLQAPSLVLNAPILATTTTSSATSVEPFASVSAVSSIQRAVDEAVGRIVSHDEL
ncbi:BAG_1a_G0013170.mRNA.1.CDS.1 [Saccharomyces cerevisiae]|nr:SX2_G0048220.mRNA.1.CDS.1 [Saccharomyces cerevisiae]CAI4376866.1 BAG_1a_G0013170.mRNA.1.CDS.1 [Saccharomyces cerevisiae]CAI7085704.1 BAG_1a_G0013170.mRNA.1.CDS.1 [Saccharomyces cerevisiae]